MFSNLSKGSILYGLDTKNGVRTFTGTVESVTLPYPRNMQNTFGQLPEMVMDIVTSVNGERKEFKQIPSNNVIADFGDGALVLSDSKDSMTSYLKSQRQKSKNIVDSYSKHQELIPQYDNAIQELNPEMVNESAVKELRSQVDSMQSQMQEMLSLLKQRTINPTV